MPGERIAQHLSELAPTDVGNHVNIHVNVITNGAVKRICSHRLFNFFILYQENVLVHPKSFYYDVLFQENVLTYPKLLRRFVLYRENVLDSTKSQCRTVSG